ncbi:dimethylsulfonioproprionate lyase family protein [Ancylobacter amanitiformis]|uniref:Prepilin-type processing-associated H-X9-DG protein n=1 Tax=Ancylobacter amanitiformis TaxID=217069 RepID=A0ABU0LSK0_9HYPH|nr:dimethylsulfonioproprionate lyase family protein [Ancylobacter amanitiformis]MDQ0511687.1 prepilin-type processing-associated H-X9-DG protein [Ancylobacter amanitiformis]
MTVRPEALQIFLDASFSAYERSVQASEAKSSLAAIKARLKAPAAPRGTPGSRLPACDHLDAALATAEAAPSVAGLIAAFRALEPMLAWRRRPTHDGTASANFADGHANAMIVGPGGVEEREDVWLGVSLLAPHVRYPDHDHAPEETYLVLSGGEFRHGESDWFAPGIGGSFYNVPAIRHAMRSGDAPLFALWALKVERPAA